MAIFLCGRIGMMSRVRAGSFKNSKNNSFLGDGCQVG